MELSNQKWWRLASVLLFCGNALAAGSITEPVRQVSPVEGGLLTLKSARSVDGSALARRQVPEFCFRPGATCEDCFGDGYRLCPGSSSNCYNPNEPRSTCPGDGNGGGGSSGSPSPPTSSPAPTGGSTITNADCARRYGTGSEVCGTNTCYNPSEGEVCCDDGSHCPSGTTCPTSGMTCCRPGSTLAACRGGGGGGGSSSSDEPTSSPTDSITFPSPTGNPPQNPDTEGDGSGGPPLGTSGDEDGAVSLLGGLAMGMFALPVLAMGRM